MKTITINSAKYAILHNAAGCSGCYFADHDGCLNASDTFDCYENECVFVPIDETVECRPEDTSAYWHESSQYYQSIVTDIGKLFGIDAYTSDDGSIQDKVLAAKVYELVTGLVHEQAKLKAKVAYLEIA